VTIRYSIIIPSYNEGPNISLNLKRYQEVIQRPDIELIIVDNGSTDDSAEILARLLPSYPFARSVKVAVNQGYGYGVLTGLHAARGEFLAWTHADMQTDPGDVITGICLIEKEKHPHQVFVKGRRKNRPFSGRLITGGMSCIESLLFKSRIYDVNAQPNIFHRSFFERWKNPPHDFNLELYTFVMARRMLLKMIRFPVQFPERIHGKSRVFTGFGALLRVIRRTLVYSIELKKNLE